MHSSYIRIPNASNSKFYHLIWMIQIAVNFKNSSRFIVESNLSDGPFFLGHFAT